MARQGDDGDAQLDEAYKRLEQELPASMARKLEWLRGPSARRFRLIVGTLLILSSFLWFLPVLGLEMLPIGLLLIAVDVPFLKKPIAAVVIWLVGRWVALRRWWRHRRRLG